MQVVTVGNCLILHNKFLIDLEISLLLKSVYSQAGLNTLRVTHF